MSMYFSYKSPTLDMYIGDYWHVGYPMPEIDARVVQFQCDGNELEVILEAMKKYSRKENIITCPRCGSPDPTIRWCDVTRVTPHCTPISPHQVLSVSCQPCPDDFHSTNK